MAQPVPGVPMSPQGRQLAEWWKRLVAIIIDGLIVGIPGRILAGLFGFGAARSIRVNRVTGEITGTSGFFGAIVAASLIALAIGAIYYSVLNGGPRGQTVGKMAMSIKVVDESTGESIGYGRAFLRWLITGVFTAACFIPYIIDGLWPLWDSKRQS